MKKSMFLLAVLVLCGLVFLFAGTEAIHAGRDQIVIEETTLFGDPDAAAGLQVHLKTQLENRLFWETSYEAGAQPQPETKFTYYGTRQREEDLFRGSVYLMFGNLNVGFGGGFSEEDFREIEEGEATFDTWEGYMVAPILEVLPKVQPGETRTETVFLRDYYDQFRVSLGVYSPYLSNDLFSAEALAYLQQCLYVPVPEQLQVEVKVEKDELGEPYNVEMNVVSDPAIGVDVWGDGFVAQDGVYLCLSRENVGLTDLTQLPMGYGLYRIPVVEEETELGTKTRLNMFGFTNVYPLDAKTQSIRSAQLSADGTQILLVVSEDEQLRLLVLDRQTMEPVQELLLEVPVVPEIWKDGELLVLKQTVEEQDRLIVYHLENGVYQLWLDTELYPQTDPEFWIWSQEICFDGTRLAVVNFRGYWDVSSHRIAVYDRNGLLYAGDYRHNADTLTNPLLTDWTDAMTIQWS